MNPVYAIGDIHGHLDLLENMLARIESDGGPDARIVFLGDYVDRGPDSRGVLELLSTGLAEGRNWVCLKGNHDRMMEWYLETPPRHDPHMLVGYHWFHDRIGGIGTMASYGMTDIEGQRMYRVGAKMREVVPTRHAEFLRGLHLMHREAGIVFAHAGVRPGVPLEAQSEEDLLWIRDEFHDDPRDHGALVVHGHTPVGTVTHYGNRINVDTGAGHGRALSAIAIEPDGSAFEITQTGRERIPVP